MPSTAEVNAYRRDLAELTRLAARDLAVVTRGVGTPEELRDLLAELLPGLVALYGAAAATVAAEWYDTVREAEVARGAFRAIPAELPDVDRTNALAGWATAKAFADLTEAARPSSGQPPVTFDRQTAVVKASGGLERIVADAARETVVTSSIQDRQAAGWQRIGSGSCDFCSILIRRGAVYTDRTVRFASHDHCNCVAVPSFGGDPLPVDDYVRTSRTITDADRARVREYVRANDL